MDLVSHGESWTVNSSECHSEESVYFLSAPSPIIPSKLSEILIWDHVPEKYYLSVRACEGILRRAEKRGKRLPDLLRLALEQADSKVTEAVAFEGNGNRPSHHGDGYRNPGEPMYTLNTTEVHGVTTQGIAWDGKETMPTITAHSHNQLMPDKNNLGAVIVPSEGGCQPVYAMTDETFFGVEEDKTPTLKARDYKAPMVVTVPMETIPNEPKVFENHSQDSRYTGPLDVKPTLASNLGTGGNNTPFVVEPKVFGICSYDSNSMKSSNPDSGFYEAETTRTLDLNGGNPSCNQGGMAVVQMVSGDPCPTLTVGDFDRMRYNNESLEKLIVEQFPMNPPEIEGGGTSNDDGHIVVRHINGSEQHPEGARCERPDVCGSAHTKE